MKWMRKWAPFCSYSKSICGLSRCGELYLSIEKNQNFIGNTESSLYPSKLFREFSIERRPATFQNRYISSDNAIGKFDLYLEAAGSRILEQVYHTRVRLFGKGTQNEPFLSRDWLAKLWREEKRRKSFGHVRQKRAPDHGQHSENSALSHSSLQKHSSRWFEGGHPGGKITDKVDKLYEQPPVSQPPTGYLKPKSPEEAKLVPLLARANLLVTRDIEWANLMLGFEQENRYAMVDPCYAQFPVGFIREQSNVIFRQLLRTRRPFIAVVTDGMGNELFRVRRPIWFINSTIYVEVDGKEIGVVHRRWHLWRRVYDLYLGNKQFAVVNNPGFWHWVFTLKDIDDNVLAEINRDWRGIGFELLTDAGQYVIRFGDARPTSVSGPATEVEELKVSRQLTLSERAVALALAVSLDNDYFSRHGGWGIPFIAFEG